MTTSFAGIPLESPLGHHHTESDTTVFGRYMEVFPEVYITDPSRSSAGAEAALARRVHARKADLNAYSYCIVCDLRHHGQFRLIQESLSPKKTLLTKGTT